MPSQRVPIARDPGPLDPERDALFTAQVAAIISRWTEGGDAQPDPAEIT